MQQNRGTFKAFSKMEYKVFYIITNSPLMLFYVLVPFERDDSYTIF